MGTGHLIVIRFLASLTLFTVGIWAQSAADPRPAFEVASVKPTPPGSLGYTSWSPFGTNRYAATNATLESLVQIGYGYGVLIDQILGVEKLGSEHYDVSVKAEDGVLLTLDQLQPRLQRLLAERFKLATHRAQKEYDGYALVVAKGGPRLKPTAGVSENGMIYPGGLRLMNITLASFAGFLRSPAGSPVIDKTGIRGNYDFTLTYARDGDTDSPLPSLFTALQEQFGLRLERSKVPLEILVIDGVEKVPSEN
jgi:uncharacterized protein (TIGR03435 family)